MLEFMESLLDEVGDRESHPLMGLLATALIHEYEERNMVIPEASPVEISRFLVQQHELRQSALAQIFGSQ